MVLKIIVQLIHLLTTIPSPLVSELYVPAEMKRVDFEMMVKLEVNLGIFMSSWSFRFCELSNW